MILSSCIGRYFVDWTRTIESEDVGDILERRGMNFFDDRSHARGGIKLENQCEMKLVKNQIGHLILEMLLYFDLFLSVLFSQGFNSL